MISRRIASNQFKRFFVLLYMVITSKKNLPFYYILSQTNILLDSTRPILLLLLEKWFPLQGERGHSSYFWSFQKIIERRGDRIKTTGHHLTLTFIIHNIYIYIIYEHYIIIIISSSSIIIIILIIITIIGYLP